MHELPVLQAALPLNDQTGFGLQAAPTKLAVPGLVGRRQCEACAAWSSDVLQATQHGSNPASMRAAKRGEVCLKQCGEQLSQLKSMLRAQTCSKYAQSLSMTAQMQHH